MESPLAGQEDVPILSQQWGIGITGSTHASRSLFSEVKNSTYNLTIAFYAGTM